MIEVTEKDYVDFLKWLGEVGIEYSYTYSTIGQYTRVFDERDEDETICARCYGGFPEIFKVKENLYKAYKEGGKK